MPHLMTLLRRLTGTMTASRLMAGLAASLISGCVAYPYTYAEPVPAMPSRFDRAWDAALGAAAGAGVQVGVADRSSGRISGVKAGAAVSIRLQTLADGSVQVAFNAPTSTERPQADDIRRPPSGLQARWPSPATRERAGAHSVRAQPPEGVKETWGGPAFPCETSPTLNERWPAAYNRRMGR